MTDLEFKTLVGGEPQVEKYSGWLQLKSGGGFPRRTTIMSFECGYRRRTAVVGFKWRTL